METIFTQFRYLTFIDGLKQTKYSIDKLDIY